MSLLICSLYICQVVTIYQQFLPVGHFRVNQPPEEICWDLFMASTSVACLNDVNFPPFSPVYVVLEIQRTGTAGHM